MASLMNVLAILLIYFSFAPDTNAGIVESTIKSSESWAFLSKFAFSATERGVDPVNGIEAAVIFPFNNSNPVLMLYYLGGDKEDEFGSWQSVYDEGLSCGEKYNIALEKGAVYDLNDKAYGNELRFTNGQYYKRVVVTAKLSTSRARWFYITIGNCKPDCGEKFCSAAVDIEYRLNLTDGDGMDFYFSVNEQGIFQTDILFLICYIMLSVYAHNVKTTLEAKRKYHYTVQLLFASINITTAYLIAYVIHYSAFASNGIGMQGLYVVGTILAGIAEFCLILMIILIAKGWTIVRRKISAMGRVRIAIYMTFYICLYWACMVYFEYGIDETEIVYVYDTWPGYLLMFLRIYAFFWLQYAVAVTIRKYRSKKRFYRKFAIALGLWLLMLPLAIIINLFIAEYLREKILNALMLSCTFVVHLSLTILYNPSLSCNSSFPFHATTTSMLQGGKGTRGGGFAGANSFKDAHLRRAADISRKIKQGVSVLVTYSANLQEFLEEIDPNDDELQEQDEDLEVAGDQSGAKNNATTFSPAAGEVPASANGRNRRDSESSFFNESNNQVDLN